jgi:hypothetical protein
MSAMTDINAAAESARENHRTTSGQFGTQNHSAPEMSLPALVKVQWTPGDYDTLIASETNPWVQADGEPVDLAGYSIATRADCDCTGDGFEGVILAMDTREGIQRCDTCGKFESDLDAAQHTAEVLTARTGREHTVWFTPDEEALPALEADDDPLPDPVAGAQEQYTNSIAMHAQRRDYLNRQFDILRRDEAETHQRYIDEALPAVHPDAVKVVFATYHLGGPTAEVFDATDEPIKLSEEQKTQRANLARTLSSGLQSGVHTLHLSPPAPTTGPA